MSYADIIETIQGLARSDFYKSMTSDLSSRIWQDVYHAHFHHLSLYVKFTRDDRGLLRISLTEK